MSITVKITDSINVRVKMLARKKKTDANMYRVYIKFSISQNGLPQMQPEISTGISVPVNAWSHDLGKMKGKSLSADITNNELTGYLETAKHELEIFKANGDVKTCSQVEKEISSNVKQSITGRVEYGTKVERTEKAKKLTVDYVLNDKFTKGKPVSPERQRIYKHALSFLHKFYSYNTPLITNIHEEDLQDFEVWFNTTCRKQNGERFKKDTVKTWFTMIAAIFVHAHKRMKAIKALPLPDGFRGEWDDKVKEVLNPRECMAIINLDESTLTGSQLYAKHCLVLQLCTGIGYADLKNMTRANKRNDANWFLQKNRNKTQKQFTVYLTSQALGAMENLQRLRGGTDTLFNLPDIGFINRIYKQLGKKAKVETHVTTYVLRHTFSVDYMDNKGQLDDLAMMLGNDVKTAAKYGRISKKRLSEKAQQLEQTSIMHQVNYSCN